MTTPFIVTKSTKSVGIAILLTLVLGPIGLFYASITGGLLMTFIPIFLAVAALIGVAQENTSLFEWSFGLLIIFTLTYWVVNIIWAVMGVLNYNKKIEEDVRRQFVIWNTYNQQNPNQLVVNINQKTSDVFSSELPKIDPSSKPTLQEWLKNNPSGTINEYFSKFER